MAGAGGPWGQGLKSLNFVHFQGPEHVKHEGLGLPGLENSLKNERKKRVKYSVFARRMTFSLGLATFLTPKTQPNRAKTSLYKAKPCILLCFCVFLHDFRVFECPGAPRAAPGTPQGVSEALQTLLGGPNGAFWTPPECPNGLLLERSWCLLRRSRGALDGSSNRGRSRGASGGLLALSWGLLEPWDLILEPFLSGKAVCFGVLRHRNRNRNRLLVFSFGNFRSTWVLALVSQAWA